MVRRSVRAGLALVAVCVAMLDVWHWSGSEPLLFGWMPYGLWWPTAVALIAIPIFGWAFDAIFGDGQEPEGQVR